MKKIALLVLFIVSLYTAEAQTSGWVMNLGDGVYYWNSWENGTRSSNVKDEAYSEAYYDKVMAEGKLEMERMVSDAEGIEKLIRSVGFRKKVIGEESVYDLLTGLDFEFIGRTDFNMKFELEEDGLRHVISVNEYYHAGKKLLAVTLASTNKKAIANTVKKLKKQSSNVYSPNEDSLDPIYSFFADKSSSSINVAEYSYKSDTFHFQNLDEEYDVLGVLFEL